MNTADLIARASALGLTITTAESCTAGMTAAALTDPAGASRVFERGFVTYSNAAKIDMLGVRPETLERTGAVSEETAREMAEGARHRAAADIAVSITGIAGPGGSEFKPEGRVCFALARSNAPTISETCEFGALGRGAVRLAARDHALGLIAKALDQP
ncbi:CinA family protein [Falsirhodobacter sp. alg1]|uniref:CinA family protein n=1 Tax=Falsirhodobacter sp. alg1 TaxID=1472418 RepID=UPI0005ED7052|nr:CinA family protein [Falsirhodobacter sp. alg1]